MMGRHVPYDGENESFLNNFYCRFPSGVGLYPQGLARATAEIEWHETNRERYRKMLPSEADFDDYCSKLSDRYLDETPEQFFSELDRTVLEVGLSLEGIMQKIQSTKDGSLQECLHRDAYLKPVYVEMRKKGYNKKELWG